jgi:hypothetical protein
MQSVQSGKYKCPKTPSSLPCKPCLTKEIAIPLFFQWIMELDSSTAEKFSRHIIVRVPGRAFPNNLVMGHFVSNLTSSPEARAKLYVAREGRSNGHPSAAAAAGGSGGNCGNSCRSRGEHLQGGMQMAPMAVAGGGGGAGSSRVWIGAAQGEAADGGAVTTGSDRGSAWPGLPPQPPHPAAIAAAEYAAGRGGGGEAGNRNNSSSGDLVCFVDSAVYTKNRHFRLIWSSKGGKKAVLEPTTRFAMSAAAK